MEFCESGSARRVDLRQREANNQMARRTTRVHVLLATVVVVLSCLGANVEAVDVPASEMYSRDVALRSASNSPENTLGESVDDQTGGLSFSQTDIDLPGIGPAIQIVRTYDVLSEPKTFGPHYQKFADWTLAIPRIKTLKTQGANPQWWPAAFGGSDPNARCSAYPLDTSYYEMLGGLELQVPGHAPQQILSRSTAYTAAPSISLNGVPVAFPLVTNRGWQIGCIPNGVKNRNVPGEAFLAVSPEGTKYWFDWVVLDYVGTWAGFTLPPVSAPWLNEASLMVTKIEDRFGNQVTYRYEPNVYDIESDRLVEISASDGRKVALQWTGDLGHTPADPRPRHYINKIITQPGTPSAREWNYAYEVGIYGGVPWRLRTVTLPDGSGWRFDIDSFRTECGVGSSNPSCPSSPTYAHGGTLQVPGSITTPSGLTATYWLVRAGVGRHGDTGGNIVGDPEAFMANKLGIKRYTGTGVNSTWTYSYLTQYPHDTAPPVPVAQMRVLNPDGTLDVSYVDNTVGNVTEGQVLQLDRFKADQVTLARRQVYEYASAPGPYPATFGTSKSLSRKPGKESVWPLRKVTISQDGATFIRTVNTFDAHARPTDVTLASSLGYSKTEVTAYYDSVAKWTMGQVQSVTCTAPVACKPAAWPNGIVATQTIYDAATALPYQVKSFGRLEQTMTYNTNGTLATVSDGSDTPTYDTTIHLSQWKRGIPQQIQYPAIAPYPAVFNKAAVDDNGWIDWVTDENGYKTCYDQDLLGRRKLVNAPLELPLSTCDTLETRWNATTSRFKPEGAAIYGLPLNHWVKVIETGNARQIIHMDAMWRPVVEETYSVPVESTTRSVIVKRYDSSGRQSFQSYPLRTLTSYTSSTLKGMRTFYDELGRVVRTERDSDGGVVLKTTTAYESGFKTRVTLPKHQGTSTSTLTEYIAWDRPSYDLPDKITHPADAVTDIVRDVFGKPSSIIRRNTGSTQILTRQYVYDPTWQTLCKVIEPETGTTVMKHDVAGNLIWTAGGLNLTSPTNCNLTEGFAAASRVDRLYDRRNRLTTLSFPDGNGDQDWTYYRDGLPLQVTTWNVPSAGAAPKETINTYMYNERRLLIDETVAHPAWYTYALHYDYNANGHQSGQSYPSGQNLLYSLNALGQTVGVYSTVDGIPDVTYASNISYHPNGALESFTYGNGVVHTMLQNERQLPKRSTDKMTGLNVLDLAYGYDNNGNVATITDYVQPNHDRSMLYDDLDRLTQATSPQFGTDPAAIYSYNTLDDLQQSKVNGRNTYYCYDAKHQLQFLRTGSVCSGNASPAHTYFTYDARGNLDGKDAALGVLLDFDFDTGNRLREVKSGGIALERYRYDALGRRTLASRISGPADTLGVILSQYANSGELMYQVNDRPGVKQEIDYIYLAGSLLAKREESIATGAVSVKYQHTDALGSPVAVTSEAVGGATPVVAQRIDYEPYGKVLGGAAVKDGPGYTGHVLDAATGMNYMQQRYYDPEVGRFLSVDPISVDAGMAPNFNRYWYANNNPYRFTDPDGRFARGSGFASEAQWAAFMRAQKRAAGSLEKAAEKITKGMTSAKGMEKLTKSFEKNFGPGSGTPANMAKVAADMSTMAAALRDTSSTAVPANAMTAKEMTKAYSNMTANVMAGVPNTGPKQVVVNLDHPGFNIEADLSWALGHESAHTALGYEDQRLDGTPAYKMGEPEQMQVFKTLPAEQRLVNPDHLMDRAQ